MALKHIILGGALAALVAMPAAAETVKIGVVLSLSGADSLPGQQVELGIQLYMKEHQKNLRPGV